MGTEIERKFLVRGDAWRALAVGVRYRQGYLSTDKSRTVRVRTIGKEGFLTVKGLSTGISRTEFEYAIAGADAEAMLTELCLAPLIEKDRYTITAGALVWEVDEFLGENLGLIVAEVELESPDQVVELPPWIGAEVSDDPRYFNSSLIAHPYSTWDRD